jgi:hypothetical protein
MKISPTSANQQHERGFMVVALLVILALLLIYTSANIQTLNILDREIKAVQKKQIQRLKNSETQSFRPEPVKQHSVTSSFGHDRLCRNSSFFSSNSV